MSASEDSASPTTQLIDDLVIPPVIDAVIREFDAASEPFDEHKVQSALSKARTSLDKPSAQENLGAWAEVLAFTLTPARQQSPWGTYFGPMGSGTDKEGNTRYFPDIADANAGVIHHWAERAVAVKHSVLKARYSDLVWDLCGVIGKVRRDPDMARLAIDSYLDSVYSGLRAEQHDRFEATVRAFDLAVMLRDEARIAKARSLLLSLHHAVVAERGPQWWLVFDRLIEEKNGGVTDEERAQLVRDLEDLVLHYGDVANPKAFDPHALESAAKRLVRHYTRLGQGDHVNRHLVSIAKAFEHFASMGDAMLASAVLQTAVNAYRDAGLGDDSRRVRILMEQKIAESRDLMKPIQTEYAISHEDMEKFLNSVVLDDLGESFVRIASEFLVSRPQIEKEVRETAEHAPLLAHLSQSIMADDHIAAKIGSVEDDLSGRLVQQADRSLSFASVWLRAAFDRTIEKHSATAEHFVGWANRYALYDDVTLLIEGVNAWLEGDHIKAVHVLVPQIEHGLRSITGQLGKPVTKAHGTVAGVGVAVGMGDILYSKALTDELGPDLTLHFLALYADPRGTNLRNRVAHGLIGPAQLSGKLVRLLIHTLLVFGIWKELAANRR